MRIRLSPLLGLAFGLLNLNISAQLTTEPATAPTAEGIMQRVAANQDRAEADRARYVYVQHARVISRKGKAVMCEEVSDSRVTPSNSVSHVELLKLDGRVLVKHKYVTYTTLLPSLHDNMTPMENDQESISIRIGDEDTDRNLVEHMRTNLTNDRSKDGISQRLFPLTTNGQKTFLFHLIGRERLNGREVFHLDFRPKDKDEFGWKGEAYIDITAYQPVVVSTAMARKIPFAVRTLLGTNIPGLGFTVVYAPQPDGVWFPVTFGTEFKLHVLFLFSREIVIDAQNGDFEKTHVSTRIVGSEDGPKPE